MWGYPEALNRLFAIKAWRKTISVGVDRCRRLADFLVSGGAASKLGACSSKPAVEQNYAFAVAIGG
jgi:hypothetical protein